MKKGTYIDLTGQKFNHLTAIKYLRTEKGKGAVWLFRCDCGNEVENLAGRVKSGNTTSCGCEKRKNHAYSDLKGRRFGRWLVEEKVESDEKGSWWKCRCDCGTTRIMKSSALYGGSRSCGCLRYKMIDSMIGMRYGKWTVMERDTNDTNESRVICRCDCGTIRSVSANGLRRGTSKSCGCEHIVDLTGKRIGRLTVLHESEPDFDSNGKKIKQWLCKCDCGNKKVIRHGELSNGHTCSCGCLHKEMVGAINRTHGLSESNKRLYKVWKMMRRRCNNPKDKSYGRYGGIGIHVCHEWNNSFLSFYEWSMANGYIEDIADSGRNRISLDRIDNDGDYEPNNCRWTNNHVQAMNKGHNLGKDGKVVRSNDGN